MDAKKLMIRIGAVMLAAMLAIGLIAPVLAGVAPAEVEGTIEKIIYKDELPEMAKAHGILKILKVDGVKLLVTAETEIDGMTKLGKEIEAKGEVHAIAAETIKVKDDVGDSLTVDDKTVTIEGTIDKIVYKDELPMMLVERGVTKLILVDGVHIFVTETTMKDGMLKVGAGIKVVGCLKALIAEKIEVEG